jgi:hypothetical protein
MRRVTTASLALLVACSGHGASGPEDFSGITDTKSDNPVGWVFRGRMDPGMSSTFTLASTDKYHGILMRVEDADEGNFVAEIHSDDGEPLVFLVQPDGQEVPGIESKTDGGDARLEAHGLAPGKYFLVTRERSNKAATFTVSLTPEDPGMGSGSDPGMMMPPTPLCPGLTAVNALPNLATAKVPTAPAQVSDTEGNLVTDGAGHTLVTYTSLNFASVFTAVTSTVACTEDGVCDASTLGQFPYQGVGAGYTCDPVLAHDATTGRAYLAWINVSPRGSSEIVIATSDDMGQSWQNVHTVASAKLDLLDKPWIAAANNRVLVSYADFNQGWGPVTMDVVESKDGGRTFSDPIAVTPTPASQNLGQLALSPDGMDAMFTWWNGDANALDVARATGGTTVFTAPIAVDGGGTIAFDAPGNALGGDGRLWISFVRQTTSSPNGEVAVAIGTPNASGGLDFQPTVQVADAAARGCASVMHPTVTIDENNAAHVAFYDDRYGVGHVWTTSSTDGTTWSPNASFTPDGFLYVPERHIASFEGDYLGIVAHGGRVSAAFAQVPTDTTQGPAAHFYLATSK